MKYGLEEHTGFILLTGEVGAGKTTIIRSLLETVSADMVISKIFNTQVNSAQLLRLINDDFGIVSSGNDKADLQRDLNDFLIAQYAAKRRSILIVDEAQNLGLEQLEEIRLLSNLETSQQKLLQIILVGQPELRDRLSSPSLIQLRQRILVHCHLSPLNVEETEAYILHRLELAGNRYAMLWGPGALECVHAATRGVPRLINILCHFIFLDAFSNDSHVMSVKDIESVLRNVDFKAQYWPEPEAREVKAEVAELCPPHGISPELLTSLESLNTIADKMQSNMGVLMKAVHVLANSLLAALEKQEGQPFHSRLRSAAERSQSDEPGKPFSGS